MLGWVTMCLISSQSRVSAKVTASAGTSTYCEVPAPVFFSSQLPGVACRAKCETIRGAWLSRLALERLAIEASFNVRVQLFFLFLKLRQLLREKTFRIRAREYPHLEVRLAAVVVFDDHFFDSALGEYLVREDFHSRVDPLVPPPAPPPPPLP